MRTGRTFALQLTLVALAALVLPPVAGAQTGLASITGIVFDASGAAVPGLTVTAMNPATNIAYTGVTNETGNYIITGVPIGTYVIATALQHFKSVQSAVTLSAGQTARVDFRLAPGGLEERIEVVSTTALLQTENAVVGRIVEREQVEALPLQGRNLAAVSLYTPGVVSTQPNEFDTLRGEFGRPAVNGQRQQVNNFTVDGIDSNEALNNLIAYQPSPDAVEQVSVESNNYSAELGNVAGAVVNMVIKSGTNQYRGNGFYYWRDNRLAATPWATNRAGGAKAKFSRDVFGGTFGGPLLQNRLFFFGDYQGGRQDSPPTDAFATVVPDEWRRGDLSSLLSSGIVIRDPLTGQPFPNNQIPVTRFSNFARNLFADESLYPRANVARPLGDFRQNYKGVTGNEQQVDQFDVKVDWNASAQDKVYVRYSRQAFESAPLATVMPLSFASAANHPFWGMAVNWNRIFGKSMVNELLAGVNDSSRLSDPIDLLGLGKLNNELGIPGDQAVRGLSNIRWGNDLTQIGSAETGANNVTLVYQVNERLTWLLGRHTLKFGGSWNYYQSKSHYPGSNGRNGFIAFTAFDFTGAPFADFLLDQVSQKGRGSVTDPWTHLQHRSSIYAADDFKIVDTLTLDLGMRWAYTSPFVEKDDRQANFDLSTGQIRLAGQNGNSRALYKPFYNGWEPRVGLAYRTTDRWVLRGAYGIAQYMEGTGANLRL
ncbi:MAG TPA: carboxypeptidase regulatory-like domain-containing protein, partial [Vicinamibacterales bacterium]|nr:carboxypeptidase regulatory-like domain-containing protein [Vicinamibacterales bacterium]